MQILGNEIDDAHRKSRAGWHDGSPIALNPAEKGDLELIAVLRRSGHTLRRVSEGNMAISALNLNNNTMCELGAMFYFETMRAPFAHKHDFGFVMRGGPATRWRATRTLTLIDLLSPISRRNTQRRAAMREIFFSKASTIERRSRTFG